MKKRISLCILITFILATTGFTNCYSQSNEFPPIQKFLDKIDGDNFEENMTIVQNISQSITNNSFTWVSKSSTNNKLYKKYYSGLNWNDFDNIKTYWLKNEKNYIKCYFTFTTKIKVTAYEEGIEFYTNNDYYIFFCIILEKDKEAFLKVVNDWNEARNR